MSVIDDLLASAPPAHRKELERIRNIVLAVCPEANEVMTYGMLGFKYKGKYLIAFGSFKDHMSLFPTGEPIRLLQDKLQPYKTSTGTIQFTPENNMGDELVRSIVQLCIGRIDRRSK